MNAETLKYLKKDQIGKVVATGLATLYMNQPNKPVRYLAEWLKDYSHNQKQMAKLVQSQKQKLNIIKKYQIQQQIKNVAEKEKQNKQQKIKETIQKFKQVVRTHLYHEDLLQEQLPQFIEKNIQATGVYIGQLNYPHKEITDQDTADNAHLNITADKIINYIGSSLSHKEKVRGKSIKTTQGITASSFALLQEAPAPIIGQDGQQIPQPVKPKYIFVPNVVKNQSIHYFNIPKLGSYLAVPIICNQYLTQSNFDSALKQKQQYIHECQQLQKTKKTQIEQLDKEKQQLQKKLAELTEKNADQSQTQPIKTELKQIQEALLQKQKQFIQQKQPILTSNIKKYVICTDTLGKDKAFSQAQVDFITGLTYHFAQSWQKQQKNLLKQDIDAQIQGLKHLHAETSVIRQQIHNQLKLNEEEVIQLAAITQQHNKNRKKLQFQVNKLKKFLQQNKYYEEAFLHMKKFRVIKYKQLVQNILFFLSHKKAEVNIPQRATLNWREVKNKLISQTSFKKILHYNPIGQKKQNFVAYNKTPHLVQIFDKFDQAQIFKYNIGLGAITLFIKKALQLRQIDVQIRNTKYEADKKNLQHLIQQNEKINQKYTEQLEKHKSGLSAQDSPNFNQNDWRNQFYLKNPLHVIVEPVQDIDNDM